MTDPTAPVRAIDPSRRQFVFGGAMLAASAGSFAVIPAAGKTALGPHALEAAVPLRLGGWNFVSTSGFVLPPEDENEARVYDQVLTRAYDLGDGGPAVMLLIAYGGGQTGLFEIHRPEACYPAQGYALTGRAKVPVPIGDGRAVTSTFWTATSDVRIEQMLYWTRIGEYFPESWAAEHVAVVRSNLMLSLPDGVLVRMSVLSNDPEASIARLELFARALVAGVRPAGRRVMLGPNA